MQTGKIDVAYVAKLCRLKLNQEEIERFNAQLGDILKLVEQLQKIDVSGVPDLPPDFAASGNVLRKDEDRESFPVELALKNAPAQINDLFIVPKIVE